VITTVVLINPLHPINIDKVNAEPANTLSSNVETAADRDFGARWARLLEWMRRNPQKTDTVLALTFTVFMVTTSAVGWSDLTTAERGDTRWWAFPLALAGAFALIARRRFPEVQFLFSSSAVTMALIGGLPDTSGVSLVIGWISIYGVSAYGGKWRTPARFVGVVGIFAALLLADSAGPDGNSPSFVTTVYAAVITIGFLGSAWLFGDTMRIRRQQAQDLALRAAELEIERDRNAERAVTEERLRIARELHDVMAHHVTVIGVQASAADRTLEKDPASAHRALATITTSSREIIEELQRLLGFLRSTTEGPQPSLPQPTVSEVNRLVADANGAGGNVTLTTNGPLEALPGSVSLSAYRIVQEALTNVRKHAGNATAAVSINVNERSVVVRIESSEPNQIGQRPSVVGHGLLGMRERARLVGGTLSAGPTASGWVVEAILPRQAGNL
jgi:signal transduction histidine kinase